MRHRIWRMTYGWRSNMPAAAAHMASSVCYNQAASIAKHSALRFRSLQARCEGLMQLALGVAAMVPRWVRVGKAHRWEIK